MSEMFKPKQFDSFEKVPEDQKSNFKKEEDGSFVYNEAAQELSDAELTAEIANKPKEQGITSMDVLKKKAKDEQKRRQIIIKDIKEGNVNEKKMRKYFFGDIFRQYGEQSRDDKEIVLEAVKRHSNDLCFVSKRLKNDKEVVMEAVRKNGYALQYASKELRNDKEVVFEAIKENSESLRFASEELKVDKNFMLDVVKRDGRALQHATEEFKANKEVVMEAIKQYAGALQYASPELKADKEVVLVAVKQDGEALQFAAESIRNEIEKLLRS